MLLNKGILLHAMRTIVHLYELVLDVFIRVEL
jgi:hypothetical protein